MSRRGTHKVNTKLWWLGLGTAAVGCLDPVGEDPGFQPRDQAEVMPIPVSPGGVDAPDITGTSGAVAPSQPVIDVAPPTTGATSATAGSTSTGSASATATSSAPSSGTDVPAPAASDPNESSSDQGATGAVPGDLDAGAFDEPDADAGPDGSLNPTSGQGETTGTGPGSGS